MIAAIVLLVALKGPVPPLVQVEAFPGPRLMKEPAIRQELGISLEEAYRLFYAYSREFNVIQSSRRPQSTLSEKARAMQTVLSHFTPEQRKRLGELYVQVHKTMAFLDPTVAARLGLTSKQRGGIQEIYDRVWLELGKERQRTIDMVYRELGYKPSPVTTSTKHSVYIPKDVQERLEKERPRMRKFRDMQILSAQSGALAVLADVQKRAFEKMGGKPSRATLPEPAEMWLWDMWF